MDKLQILVEALKKISQIAPSERGTGRRIAQKALRQFYELETIEETAAEEPEDPLTKYKSLPCSCNRKVCKDSCCGQCGCVPCFLSGREAKKLAITDPLNAA